MKEQVYHILITKKCEHNCKLCCNRLYDLNALPTITFDQLRSAHTVCLTGGDPFMLEPDELIHLCSNIRGQCPNIEKLYIYSSGSLMLKFTSTNWHSLLPCVDGMNFAPKNESDWYSFRLIYPIILSSCGNLSNRLYVFDDQWWMWEKIQRDGFTIPENLSIIGRKWDRTFNTPENEHFVRLPILY